MLVLALCCLRQTAEMRVTALVRSTRGGIVSAGYGYIAEIRDIDPVADWSQLFLWP